MENKEIIEQLIQMEKIAPNDFELGTLVREFIYQNFKNIKEKDERTEGIRN